MEKFTNDPPANTIKPKGQDKDNALNGFTPDTTFIEELQADAQSCIECNEQAAGSKGLFLVRGANQCQQWINPLYH